MRAENGGHSINVSVVSPQWTSGNDTRSRISDSASIIQPLYSDRVLAAFTAAYVIIFLVGLCGNVLTCLVVLRRHYVHSQTPFYLNLAFSDLLLLAGLPADVYFFWHPYGWQGGGWFCVARAVVTESATNASILTIVIFTAERWISICDPIKSTAANFSNSASNGGSLTRGKNRKFVLAIWLTAVIAAVPLSAQLGLVPLIDRESGAPMEDAAVCHIVPDRAVPYSFEASSVIFFVFPMILIIIFYWSIIIKLRKTLARQASVHDSPLMHAAGRACQQAKASGAVVKILIAVVVAFFICFSPHHLQRLLASYISTKADAFWASFSQFLFTISGVSYYISTAVNPVIYCLLSKRFRFALQNLILCRRRRRKATRQHFPDDLLLLNQFNGRGLFINQNERRYARPRGPARYPTSRPVAVRHGHNPPVQQMPAVPVARPGYSSSTCLQQNVKSTTNRTSLNSNSRQHRPSACADKKARSGVIEQCPRSDCYNVYYDGDRLVISFVSDKRRKEEHTI